MRTERGKGRVSCLKQVLGCPRNAASKIREKFLRFRLSPSVHLDCGEPGQRIDKDAPCVEGEECNGCCPARDQNPQAARRRSGIWRCRALSAARWHSTFC